MHKHKKRKLIEKYTYTLPFLIDRNFSDMHAFGHEISGDKKKILSVIYPDLKKFSGDYSARTFLRLPVKIYNSVAHTLPGKFLTARSLHWCM